LASTAGENDRPVVVWLATGQDELPELAATIYRVGSPYEAAAEMLRRNVAALVVELPALPRRHLRLLEIARRHAIPVLAYGPLGPATSTEQLHGVQLVARSSLGPAIQQHLGPPAAVKAVADSPHGQPPARPQPAPPAPTTADEPADAQPPTPAPRAAAAEDASSLLSPEELAALLENEP
jgi:cell division septation protein DedD